MVLILVKNNRLECFADDGILTLTVEDRINLAVIHSISDTDSCSFTR